MAASIDFGKNPVFTKAYWKNQDPLPPLGDADEVTIHTSVGYALSAWEEAEVELMNLYLLLIGGGSDAARRAFGTIESHATRRLAIQAAAEGYFGQEWSKKDVPRGFSILLNDAVAPASKLRNNIAHGVTITHFLNERKLGAFHFPPAYNTERTRLHADVKDDEPGSFAFSKFRFTSAFIFEVGKRFLELKSAIQEHAGLCRLFGATSETILARGLRLGEIVLPKGEKL